MSQQSTNQVVTFDGFAIEQEFPMPMAWQEISKRIDNLAEYKVVEFILWITWGDGQAGAMIPLTYETIAEYTGLSKQSVGIGIERAIEHGYIERQIEYYSENGRVRSIRVYGLKLHQPEDKNVDFNVEPEINNFDQDQESLFSDELALEADSPENQISCFSSSNEFELSTQNYYYEDVSRIQEDQYVDDDQPIEPSPRKTKIGKYPAFLCARIEQFSQTLGDFEHTASNIGQAHHIYLDYIARGGNAQAFIELMQQAKEITQKKSCIRRKNQKNQRNAMPYFFACLKRACKGSKDQVAA